MTGPRVSRMGRAHVLHGDAAQSLRAPGPLLLGPGARVMGDVDARGPVHLARGAHVAGSVRAVGDVVLGAETSVAGGVRAEGNVVVQAGARVTGDIDAAGDVPRRARSRVGRLHAGGDLHISGPVIAPKVLVRGRVHHEAV